MDFRENCTRGTSFAYARAFQQRFSFFAVTSVTHLLKNTDLFWKNDYFHTHHHRLFSTLFSLFQLSKSKQTLTKQHIPLYFNLLREPLWHLWQQKHKTPIYVCMYARTRRVSHPSFHIFNTMYSLLILSHKNSIFPNLLFHLFPMPSRPFSTFHKTTACFS